VPALGRGSKETEESSGGVEMKPVCEGYARAGLGTGMSGRLGAGGREQGPGRETDPPGPGAVGTAVPRALRGALPRPGA